MNKQIVNLAFLSVLLALFAFTQAMPAAQKKTTEKKGAAQRAVYGSYSAKVMKYSSKK
ncbi:hypothetical protein [Microscilla marina]|uniref:Uncharacterized protein n=1 Tax=Microscilla marina ATCC 23134 TaxID=313606 RepID=A1ZPU7_MICM2|nr:hypothetical protein [Microscilla marina]EAY27602.1 hypothetical protein M23134_02849 [Microscilla marina ATCC 23134]